MTVNEEKNPLNDRQTQVITRIARKDRYNVNYFHLLCYAFSSLAFAMMMSTFNFFSTKYLLDTAKLSPLLTSIITFLSRLFDGITDAIYAYFINKSKITKFGKMTPWIFFSSPLIVISYLCVWYRPNFSDSSLLIWYLTWYTIFQTVLTGFRVPHTTMVMYITDNLKKRESATVFRLIFEMVGVLLAILNFWFMVGDTSRECTIPISLQNQTEISNNLTNFVLDTNAKPTTLKEQYFFIAIMLSGIFILSQIVLLVFVKERVELIDEKLETDQIGYFKQLKLMYTYKPFAILTVIGICSMVMGEIIIAYLELFLGYAFTVAKPYHGAYGLVLLTTSILISPLWKMIMNRFGKNLALILGNLTIAPLFISSLFFKEYYQIWIFFVLAFLSSNAVIAAHIIPWAMLPRCIDNFAKEHNIRPDTLFCAYFVINKKITMAIYFGLSQIVLNFSGYQSNVCSQYQPYGVEISIRIIFGLVPLLIMVLCNITAGINHYTLKKAYTKKNENN